jgi:polygalacturonase
MIVVEGKDIRLEGVVLRDSSTWNVPVQGSDRVRIENIKIFGYRGNSDGIDINNSRNVDVGGCFLRTFDDLVVIKSSAKDRGESADITVHDCVLWNEFAHALSLGAELRMDVERVRFTDCDVIRDKGREWVLRVYHCDAGHIRQIAFDNIRIEEGRRLMSVWIGKAIWSRDDERGHVDNVLFKNIPANASETLADLTGFDAAHLVRGVTFENVQVNGRPLQTGDVKRNEFVQDVTVRP